MKKKYTAHIVSHSHWDREWYVPLEKYRVWLVNMVDELLDILDGDDEYHAFMLDGHTALVEDYLLVKPQNEQRLARHIQSGRVLIGPWYILPDQMLISGEAHVRNYLFGAAVCRRFGKNMQLGYAPDAFGHPSQLPQLYKKLGLGEILFWRGLPDEIESNEFIWQAPDGSEILGHNLAYGYGNCPNMPNEANAFLKRVEYVVEHYAPRSAGNVMLVMNGRDHLHVQPHITAMAKAADALSDDIEVRHSSLPEYMAELKAAVAGKRLPRHRGALAASGRVALLEGTLSTRMYLKQANQKAEDLFEHWAEPFSAFAHITGAHCYPGDILNHGWRFILQNHPHDSIAGCSVDEVHREMMTRFASAGQVGATVLDNALKALTSAGAADTDDTYVAVFNPAPYARSQVVDCTLEMDLRLCNALVYEHMRREQYDDEKADAPLPTQVWLEDGAGNRVPAVLKRAAVEKVMRYYTHTQPHEFYAHCCHISFEARDVPPMGYKAYKAVLGYGEAQTRSTPQTTGDAAMENTHFKVEWKDGGLNVLDKKSGRLFEGCGTLVDDGDAGDEYLYHAAKGPMVRFTKADAVSLVKDALRQTLRVQGVMRLPAGLCRDAETRDESELVECPVAMEVSITEAEARVDFKTSVENRAKNHRLRAAFPTGVRANGYSCENIFCVDSHPLPKTDDVVVTRSQKRFASVSNGEAGALVANKGLPEIEVREDENGAVMLLTLFRSVGMVANGPTGLNIPAPEGQCLGRQVFEYSFVPHKGTWLESGAFRLAHAFCGGLLPRQMEDGKAPEKMAQSWLSVDAPELVFSAFKRAEMLDNTFILRLYNTSAAPVAGKIAPGFACRAAHLCNLREEKLSPLQMEGGAIAVNAGPWEIITLALCTK